MPSHRPLQKDFDIIVAVDQAMGIGKGGKLPWKLSEDLKRFKTLTSHASSVGKQNAVIMGRKTWESLPVSAKPLPSRCNMILTHRHSYVLPKGVFRAGSLTEALELFGSLELKDRIDRIFVIGGQMVFEEALKLPNCQRIYMTKIYKIFSCDTFFPPLSASFKQEEASAVYTENSLSYSFVTYVRC